MTFEKIQEEIERVDNFGGFLLIRKLKPSDKISSVSDEQLIADIILSKYHHWRGEEEPSGLTVGMSSTDKYGKSKSWTLADHKFYGFFDNSKIKADHYKQIKFDDFYTQLMNAIEMETENDNTFIQLSKNAINKNLKPTSKYYFLDLDIEKNKDLVAEWQVYSFFYAFISVDRESNCIYLIEFGLD
jgi:hypothetical protein